MKIAFDVHAQRITRGDEVFENDIDHVLVKDLHVTERVDVELQTLQFHAAFVGNVLESNGSEVRKVRERADRGELGNLEIDLDFIPWKLVRKSVQRKQIHLRARRGLNVETLLVRGQHVDRITLRRGACAMTSVEELDEHESRDEAADVRGVRNATRLRTFAEHAKPTDQLEQEP